MKNIQSRPSIIPSDEEILINAQYALLPAGLTNVGNRSILVAENLTELQKEKLQKILLEDDTDEFAPISDPEQEMSLLINNTEESFVLVDKQLKIISFNKQLYDLYKKFLSVIIKKGACILDYVRPERKEYLRNLYNKVLEGNNEISEYAVTDEEGNEKIYLIKYRPARNDDNKIIGVFVTALEITETKIAEEKLKLSERRFRTLVENGTDAVVILNEEGNPVYGSPTIKNLLGYTEEEVLNIKLMDVIHEDDREPIQKCLQECFVKPGEIIPGVNARVLHKNGTWRWMEGTLLNLLHDPDIKGIVDNFRDITDKVNSDYEMGIKQQMLEQAEANYRQIFEKASEPIFVHAIDNGLILDLNQKACELLGADKSEIIEFPRRFMAEEFGYTLEMAIEKVKKATHEGPQFFEWLTRHKLGDLNWVEVSLNKANIAGEERILAFFRTINDRKKAELLLQKSFEDLELITKEQNALLNTLPANIALLDKESNIIKVNKEWTKFGKENGIMHSFCHIQSNYIKVCENSSGPERPTAIKMAEGLKNILSGKLKNFSLEYPCHSPVEKRWFRTEVRPFITNKLIGAVVMHINITESKEAEEHIKLSETLLLESQRLAKLGSWSRDMITGQISWSEELYNVFGTDRATFLPGSSSFLEMIHEEDRKLVKQLVGQTVKLGIGHKMKYRIISPSGERRVIEEIGNAEKDLEGRVIRIFGTAQDITQKEELKNLLNTANNLARLGGWELDAVSNKILWSDITREIHEVDENFEPSYNQAIYFFKEGESRDIIKTKLDAALQNGEPWDEEIQIITANKNEKWVRVIGHAEFINGKCTRLYGSFQDIDQRKKAEVGIRDSEEKRRLIMNAALDAIICFDYAGKIIFWNPQSEKTFGWKEDEVMNRPLSEVIMPPGFRKMHEESIENYLRDNDSPLNRLTELKAVNREGVEFSIELTVMPIEQGSDSFFCAFIRDITQRKITEESLQISNERFNLVAKATSDIIWDWNLITGEVIRSEEGMFKMLGYGKEYVNGPSTFWANLVHPEDSGWINKMFEKTFEDPTKFYMDCEYRLLKADGSYAYIYDKGYIVRDEDGKPIRIIGATQDITKLKENEIQLQKRAEELIISNKELEQFAYVASHDLQEPLRMVTSFLGQLDKNYKHALDEKAHRYIHFAVDGAKRMRQIILDLLEYSRVGKHEDKLTKVNLNEIVNEVVLLLKKPIEEKSVKIISGHLPMLNSFRSPLLQVFQNLIGNAIKYSKDGVAPIIEVFSKEEHDHYEISIKDNGIGISKDYYEKIFIIFQRLHNKDAYSGTGMGLSIVKKIIENLGGNIWLDSVENEGTVFYVKLPKS